MNIPVSPLYPQPIEYLGTVEERLVEMNYYRKQKKYNAFKNVRDDMYLEYEDFGSETRLILRYKDRCDWYAEWGDVIDEYVYSGKVRK